MQLSSDPYANAAGWLQAGVEEIELGLYVIRGDNMCDTLHAMILSTQQICRNSCHHLSVCPVQCGGGRGGR